MFRSMRRALQALPFDEIEQILKESSYCTLAINGDDGYPFSVPVNYVYHDNCLYFHGSIIGYKADCLKKNPKVSFSIVYKDTVDPINRSTRYQSVIGFGQARLLEGEEKIQEALTFGYRFCKGYEEGVREEVYDTVPYNVYEIRIEHITGKESRALHNERMEKEKNNHL